MWLLILPISFFVRFSNLVVGRIKKFSLWSFNVIKLLPVPLILILLMTFVSLACLVPCLYLLLCVNFGYSMKNIPIPDEKSYKLQLIQKADDFLKKIRKSTFHKKAIFFMKGRNQAEPTAHKTRFTFSLNGTKCSSPQVKEV